MDTIPQSGLRPVTVKLAVALLLATAGPAITRNALRADWGVLATYVSFGFQFTAFLLGLWFLLLGKNWARWFFVAVSLLGIAVSAPHLVQRLQQHSISWIAFHCLVDAVELVALIVLFLPASNQWFRRSVNRHPG
jgi:hypothetical protein